MQVRHKISFQGMKDFEQHTAEFTIEECDAPAEVMEGCSLIEKMFIFNTLVLFEGLLFQYCEGYIEREDMEKRRKRIFGLLSPKLEKIVGNLMKSRSAK